MKMLNFVHILRFEFYIFLRKIILRKIKKLKNLKKRKYRHILRFAFEFYVLRFTFFT